MKLVDKQDRGKLCEGRNYGIGFAFAKLTGDMLETVGPISPCKDYLNDQVYSEATGKPYQRYGYSAVKTGCIGDRAYLVIAILDYKGGSKYGDKEKEIAYLDSFSEKAAEFIRYFDKLFTVGNETSVEKLETNRWVVVLDPWWAKATYRISLVSLLIRVAVESQYVSGDPIEALKNCKTGDSYLVGDALVKIEKMAKGTIPEQDFEKYDDWHNCGIVGFHFPK